MTTQEHAPTSAAFLTQPASLGVLRRDGSFWMPTPHCARNRDDAGACSHIGSFSRAAGFAERFGEGWEILDAHPRCALNRGDAGVCSHIGFFSCAASFALQHRQLFSRSRLRWECWGGNEASGWPAPWRELVNRGRPKMALKTR